MSDRRRSSSRKCVTKQQEIPSNSLVTVSTDKSQKTNNTNVCLKKNKLK
jgi:hypothetical protein